jgi:hypothetical protein
MRSEHSGETDRPWEPERYQHEAQSPAAKLPEGDVVFFLLDTVRRLDLSRFYAPYEQETRGAPPFDPAMMVCLLLYAYCVGCFAARSRAANAIWLSWRLWARARLARSAFPQAASEAFKDVFVHVVRLAGEAGLVRWGNAGHRH